MTLLTNHPPRILRHKYKSTEVHSPVVQKTKPESVLRLP